MKQKILIIDDELSTCTFLSLALKKFYDTIYATSAGAGLDLIKKDIFDLVLLDMIIGTDNGLDVLKEIKAYDNSITVIMMTAFGSIRTSVDAMKNGAFTYLAKPLDLDELHVFIKQALIVRRLSDDVDFLSKELEQRFHYQEMIGKSAPMQNVYKLIDKLKDVDSNVAIVGESGTGKELAARALHFSGKRKNERFVVINCAAIPENLLEDELFGHRRGSFTGALDDKKGRFEIANRGTIFLDEIGDMPISLQSKLLRVIQQKEFNPIGSNETRKVDVRIIAATNRCLEKLVSEGKFREDLFYRLNVISIAMPALRERKEDIPMLCSHFIKEFNADQNKSVQRITQEAAELLYSYDYPGNIRQLANIIEHAMILTTTEEISVGHLPIEIYRDSIKSNLDYKDIDIQDMLAGLPMREVERMTISGTLRLNRGRRDLTAQSLGISIRSLQNKIKEYNL